MKIFEAQIKYWDRESEATSYCEKQLLHLKKSAVCEMIETALSKINIQPKRILEIGGGSQLISRHLSKIFSDAQIVCTDISEVRMKKFNQYYQCIPSNLEIKWGVDACALPFDDGQFDLIVGDAMLHHIDFLKPALFEVKRCLAPNGKAVFVREPIIGIAGVKLRFGDNGN